jgi:uncharacterized protein (UPF0276 family)
MIKLACNYYSEVIELIHNGVIDIDYFKFPSLGFQMSVFEKYDLSDYEVFVNQLNQIRPVMIHGIGLTPINIGSKSFINYIDLPYAKKVIHLAGVNGISLHLSGIDTTLSNNENKEIIINNIRYLKGKFPEVQFFSLENVDGNPYQYGDKFGVCIEPDFISDIIHETDSDFLLDISHAYTSSKNLGLDVFEYLHRLPLDKLYEIHINGWIETETDIMSHTKINKYGYEILQNILKEYTPNIITLEYGRHDDRLSCGIPVMSPDKVNDEAKAEIIIQVGRLKEIIRRYDKNNILEIKQKDYNVNNNI